MPVITSLYFIMFTFQIDFPTSCKSQDENKASKKKINIYLCNELQCYNTSIHFLLSVTYSVFKGL